MQASRQEMMLRLTKRRRDVAWCMSMACVNKVFRLRKGEGKRGLSHVMFSMIFSLGFVWVSIVMDGMG